MTPAHPSAGSGERGVATPGTARSRTSRPLDPALALVVAAATMALQYRGSRVDLQHASLSKELLLVLLPPVVFFARRREVGNRGALRDLLAVASPSLALYVLVRWVWTPHLHVGGTRLGLESLALAAGRLPRSATGLRVEVNGMPLGELGVRPEGSAATLRGPRSILFRGDNRVVLHQGAPAIPGPTLDRITIAPLPYR